MHPAHLERLREYGSAPAVVTPDAEFSYRALLDASAALAHGLLQAHNTPDLAGERVAFMVAPGFEYVASLWGIFRAGGVAVPLCLSHPTPELAHTLDDAKPKLILAQPEFAPRLSELAAARGIPLLDPEALLRTAQADDSALPQIAPERTALLIYTSGTTGKPKAAITTHSILDAQIRAIVRAWELNASDRILHVLPLHHLHGILNALSVPLYAGACVEFLPRFDAEVVLARFVRDPALTLFMGVPTMYSRITQLAEQLPEPARAELQTRLSQFRLLVSGSAALPVSLLDRFAAVSGHTLLERYGMTEIGMALGNPRHGERRPGTVGVPFPDVEARIVDEAGVPVAEGTSGELQIRGPNVFAGYFERPEATRESFTADGFFRTGDVAVVERGYYRLLGRASVDIIKSGGFKISALEIEEVLRDHPAVAEVAVVGLPDAEWGQRVAAAVILREQHSLTLDELRAFGKERMATYKVPSRLFCLEGLPRNAMGKVEKPKLAALLATRTA